MSWLPVDPSLLGLDPADYADGQVPVKAAAGGFVPGDGGGGLVVDAGQPQIDGTVLFRYGIDTAGRPTFDDAGTSDTPAYVTLDSGRFYAQEAIL